MVAACWLARCPTWRLLPLSSVPQWRGPNFAPGLFRTQLEIGSWGAVHQTSLSQMGALETTRVLFIYLFFLTPQNLLELTWSGEYDYTVIHPGTFQCLLFPYCCDSALRQKSESLEQSWYPDTHSQIIHTDGFLSCIYIIQYNII